MINLLIELMASRNARIYSENQISEASDAPLIQGYQWAKISPGQTPKDFFEKEYLARRRQFSSANFAQSFLFLSKERDD